jgi:tellurite methyltransferase
VSTNRPYAPASRWLSEHVDLVRRAAQLGPVVDLACGRGRHALYLAEAGVPVIGLDRNADHLKELEISAQRSGADVTPVRCDLEDGNGIPVAAGSCGVILVFRFLFRPLALAVEQALCPGGILLYETFALAHREGGRGPRRSAFYLKPGELPMLFPGLDVIDYVEGPDGGSPPDITARLLARKPILANQSEPHPTR